MHALFLVQNGIGFGHISRTLAVAEALHMLGIRVTFVAQAHSLRLFEGYQFNVINFPFTHRLPSDSLERMYLSLLDAIVEQLQPDVYVEDTYPNDHYYGLPALQNVPRVLILRRIDPFYFEEYRAAGVLGHYDRIVMLQTVTDYSAEMYPYPSLHLLRWSSRLSITGPVFRRPTDNEIAAVRERYKHLGRLVVVNAGAGKDQMESGYSTQLFMTMANVALQFIKLAPDVHFIVVLGPYYDGPPIEMHPNMTVTQYEQNLPALFTLATAVVLKPGFNVVHEALHAGTQLLLAPTITYMESQRSWINTLEQHYSNVHVIEHTQVNSVATTLLRILGRESNINSVPDSSHEHVAKIIMQTGLRQPITRTQVLAVVFTVRNMHSAWIQTLENTQHMIAVTGLEPPLSEIITNSEAGANISTRFAYLSHFEETITPEIILENHVNVLFYPTNNLKDESASRWCQHFMSKLPNVLACPLTFFAIRNGWENHLQYFLARRSPRAIVVDVPANVPPSALIDTFIAKVSACGFRLTSLAIYLSNWITDLYMPETIESALDVESDKLQ